jgi:hypothetical protein
MRALKNRHTELNLRGFFASQISHLSSHISFLHFEKQGSVSIGSESPVIRFTPPDEKIGIVPAATGFSLFKPVQETLT